MILGEILVRNDFRGNFKFLGIHKTFSWPIESKWNTFIQWSSEHWLKLPNFICELHTDFSFAEELNLPADIPSYLSSQGTLSEPQEGYSNSEAGSHQQLMPPANGYLHKGTDGKDFLLCLHCSPTRLSLFFSV